MSTPQIQDIYPLSPIQQGMLFHSLQEPGSGVYVVQLDCRLHGVLDIEAFKQAWHRVIARHPILRTDFEWESADEPVQIVYRDVELPFEQRDWRGISAKEQEARLDRVLRADRRRGFNLEQAPLMRLLLIHTDERAYRFIWSVHHTLFDGWSLPIILKEVFTFYGGLCRGHVPALSPARPYREYIAWLQQQDQAAAEQFWRKNLRGVTAPTRLAFRRSAVDPAAGEYPVQHLRLSDEETAALRTFGRHHKLTLNTLVQGAWALLLSRYSGEDDVVFGTTLSGRPADLPGVESIVGVFINTLPLRTRLDERRRVVDWLEQLQREQAEVREYQYSSLMHVQEWSDVPAGESLFDSILVFENYPINRRDEERHQSNLRIRDIRFREQTNYDLTLVAGTADGLSLKIQYNAGSFDAGTIRRLLEQMRTVLRQFVASAEQRLADISLLSEHERRWLLEEWNDTDTPYPGDRCIHELFTARAEQTPDAIAVRAGGKTWTYADVDRYANRIAHSLQDLGVMPGDYVGLFSTRRPEMVAGLLGALKAGAAYVPIDPAYPRERLRYVLDDAGVRVVLTEPALTDEVPAEDVTPVLLTEPEGPAANVAEEPPAVDVTPSHVAYVMYTSGSTGRPKGTLVSHRSVANYVCWAAQRYEMDAGDGVPVHSSIGFDLTITSLVAPLMAGQTVILLSDTHGVQALQQQFESGQNVSLVKLTPSHLDLLQYNLDGEDAGAVRRLIIGGEALYGEHLSFWQEHAPNAVLVNEYGPTETVVGCCVYEITTDERFVGAVPIGRPIANTRLYVLDEAMRPVARGVPGELYVGGAGVTYGYHARPALTAERFVPDPFGDPGDRLYRTGDRVRMLPDGNLEYLGRQDDQIKLRGYRIEPGEVKAVLSRHDTVREAVVTVYSRDAQDERLVAYVTPAGEQVPTEDALRRYSRTYLPAYMVPATIVIMDSFPLTSHGKIDRASLPEPDAEQQVGLPPTTVGTIARTPVEDVLLEIWKQVLSREGIGIHDDFFELGGHSLLAMRAVARIRATFQIELPLQTLFEAPSVAELAQRIVDLLQQDGSRRNAPPLEPADRGARPPLSFEQQRLWFLDRFMPAGSGAYNISGAIQIRGTLSVAELRWILNQIIDRHESLRTRFGEHDGIPYQDILPKLDLTIPVVDLQHVPAAVREVEVHRLAAKEASRPFDLARGPLIRARVLRLGVEDHVLLLSMHHIISDGWSMGVLFRELAAFTESLFTDSEPALAPLPVQYADYAIWQREWLQGDVLDEQLRYWRNQLANTPVLDLPTDRPRPAVQTYRGAEESLQVPQTLLERLKTLSRDSDVTLFMTLLAAFKVLLHRYTHQGDIVVGSPVAGRTEPEVEELIGFFVNTLALRTDVSGNPTFLDLLDRVRTVALDAYAYQDVPFEKLVDELDVERDTSYTPLFQVMFVLQNAPTAELNLPGISFNALPFEHREAKFDLTLAMTENENGLHALLEYNTDLFDAGTVRRMLTHFQQLLYGIVANPKQRISDVALLTDEERHTLLYGRHAGQGNYREDRCLHTLFAEQAARTPDAVAVIDEARTLTYAELDRRANKLAHRLQATGVEPETIVGLHVERSLDVVVGVLGILKAGGAYLPLDPVYPAKRLAYMLDDAEAALVVTQRQLVENLPTSYRETAICLDTDWEDIAQQPAHAPMSGTTTDNLAYVIYTSGSTGRPKGVAVDHQNVLRLFAATDDWYQFSEHDVWTLFHSYAFDFSVWELWGALLYGGRVVVVSQDVSRSPEIFYDLLRREEVTVLNQTPSAFRQLMRVERERDMPADDLALRLIIFGGEALELNSLRPWYEHHGDTEPTLVNMYGITETTVHVTYRPLGWQDVRAARGSVIGEPIPDLQVYILDDRLEPVPVGVPGEMYVGGAGVSRGYLNRPALTASRFLPDPFGDTPGARLYRTGDVARFLPDGDIEYLGRIDHQVQVRGFRIELGEIEAVLGEQPGVHGVVVTTHEGASDDVRLVAYVTVDEDRAPTEAGLRAAIQQQLPDYMVPARILTLDDFPLTANGKIDRRALAAPEAVAPDTERAYVAPRSPTERRLAGIWGEVLGIEQVGIHDDFFALGGHSLLATQVVARIRSAFDVDIPLHVLFESPTIAELVTVIVEQQAACTDDDVLAHELAQIEDLSDEEIEALLAAEQ